MFSLYLVGFWCFSKQYLQAENWDLFITRALLMKVLCKSGSQPFKTIHKSNGYIILNVASCRTHT